MFRSMWSCSGRHWLRAFAVWGLFGSGVALALDDAPAHQAAGSTRQVQSEAPLHTVDPAAAAVILKLRGLVLADLELADFGDHDTVASR